MSTLASPPSVHTPASGRPEATTDYATYAQPPGYRHFWLRRLHSLLGIMFGGYVTVHLLVNATGFWPRAYQQNVDHIHSLEPMLPLIEIVAIFIPLLFHAIYGVYISTVDVKFNTIKYDYLGNVRYFLQRWLGIFLLLFVGYHIATLHKWGLALFVGQPFPLFNEHNEAYQSTVKAIKTYYSSGALNIMVMTLYLLGTWSAVFHWSNGLWTAAIAWGLTTTRDSQRRWGHVCFGFGIVMFVIGTMAWAAFTCCGKPDLPVSATTTVPEETSTIVCPRASLGEATPNPHTVSKVSAKEKDGGTPAEQH